LSSAKPDGGVQKLSEAVFFAPAKPDGVQKLSGAVFCTCICCSQMTKANENTIDLKKHCHHENLMVFRINIF